VWTFDLVDNSSNRRKLFPLITLIKDNLSPGSTVITDSWSAAYNEPVTCTMSLNIRSLSAMTVAIDLLGD